MLTTKNSTTRETRKRIYEHAGIVGIDPKEFSYREIVTMSRAKQQHNWNLIAPLICVTANVWLPANQKLTIEDVNPFAKKKIKPFDKSDWLHFVELVGNAK